MTVKKIVMVFVICLCPFLIEIGVSCHAERSEESALCYTRILRCAQHDIPTFG